VGEKRREKKKNVGGGGAAREKRLVFAYDKGNGAVLAKQ